MNDSLLNENIAKGNIYYEFKSDCMKRNVFIHVLLFCVFTFISAPYGMSIGVRVKVTPPADGNGCAGYILTVLDSIPYPYYQTTDPAKPGYLDGYEYLWIFDDETYSYEKTPHHKYNQQGPHNVVLELTPRKRDGGPPPTAIPVGDVPVGKTCSGENMDDVNGKISLVRQINQARSDSIITVILEYAACNDPLDFKLEYNSSHLSLLTNPYPLIQYPTYNIPDESDGVNNEVVNIKIIGNPSNTSLNRCIVLWFRVKNLLDLTPILLRAEHNPDPPIATCGFPGKPDLTLYAITGPYDPNEKHVSVDSVRSDTAGNNLELTYTIHFQNLGNGRATMIYVSDSLNDYFDYSTVKILGSSFDGRFCHYLAPSERASYTRPRNITTVIDTIRAGNKLIWKIEHELWGTNEPGYKKEDVNKTTGWVQFKVRTNDLSSFYLQSPFNIENKAAIKFEDGRGIIGIPIETDSAVTMIFDPEKTEVPIEKVEDEPTFWQKNKNILFVTVALSIILFYLLKRWIKR